ncbi:DNA polymerase/3'-5' exonuclease PolX [Thiohalobacter sp. COW1]|uniref:DNA polymerase/3'-5' exonuclease PolX n=1 Tax=Thiohalobacter sp. COW1 TaxID=2795687 RepID=UPI0019163552|nr:DNA polymerase/3'-5' exonuclease PolX [Thiohalobacter sp. COW1]BCO30303.1 DNA polymerase/3'-5' exonuclease PolX [Thiohalobacter sp. COW1]
MPSDNEQIAEIFDEIADLLEIEGDNPFRIRAYRNAARNLRALNKDVRRMRDAGEDLTDFPGIGKDLAAKIEEILDTGRCRALDKLRRKVPPDLGELLRLPGIGPKRVHALYHELDIQNLEQLQRAARDGEIRELSGFGPKTEARLMEAVEKHRDSERRFKLAEAARYAEPLTAWLEDGKDIEQVVIAGSYRRAKETVGDLDILVIARDGRQAIQHFTRYEEVDTVVSSGSTRATVILNNGLQVDLRVVPRVSYGAALYYFTGSKAHNIAVRRIAQKKGWKINEYGLYEGDKRIAGETEASLFKQLGLAYIEPELRENRGEIEAAREDKLPKLIKLTDLRGDLHCHTRASDGQGSLRAMAEAARDRGLDYLAITEHSKHLAVAHGLDSDRLLKQVDAIAELNDSLDGITLLSGIEVDILEDGSLDLPDEVLDRLDLVIGAVHSQFNLSRKQQTERILRAMDSPHFTLLAHPSGRLIDKREPYAVDMERIIHQAAQRGCYLELNANPDRLDLLDSHCRLAKEEGVLVSINSDAHSPAAFEHLRFGIGQARRGWLEKDDVLNTRSLTALRKLLKQTRQ